MKKLIFVFLLLPSLMFAQRSAKVWWFDVGAKVQTGFTGLYNQVIADDGMWAYDPGKGTTFGGKLGINYDVHGFTVDAMFGSSTNKFEGPNPKVADVKVNVTDLYVLYRNNKSLGYFELGPKLSLINKVENSILENNDVTDQYAANALGGVLGFGVYFLGSDGAMSGILGLRFEYGFTDIVDEAGIAAAGDPAPVNDSSFSYTGRDYGSTHPIFAGIVFELNFGLGYFGRAGCGRRSKFIRF